VATIMQKALTPQTVGQHLSRGWDQVAGFTLRAADVLSARTPAELFEAHALGFPGSPFSADMPSVHLLRFPATAQMRFDDAVGGNDNAGAALTGGSFVDRPPFTGNGFAPWSGGIAPVYWLVSSRVPAGSEIVRADADGTVTLVAVYADVATGWVAGPGQPPLPPVALPPMPSLYLGLLARYQGGMFAADLLLDEQHVVLSAPAQPAGAAGFARTPAGRWRLEVPLGDLTELFEVSMTGVINGIPVRVTGESTQDGQKIYHVVYTGHNADIAEALGLTKLDAGVYAVAVRAEDLTDVQTVQLIAPSWPGA